MILLKISLAEATLGVLYLCRQPRWGMWCVVNIFFSEEMSRVLIGVMLLLIVELLLLSVGWMRVEWGRGGGEVLQESVKSVEVVVDTLHYASIEPIRVTALNPREGGGGSPSVEVESLVVADSLYEFGDEQAGRWSAEIAGRNVELRSLTLHDVVERVQVVKRELPKWDVALKAAITPDLQWFGVGVIRNVGRLSLSLDCGYDPWRETPYLGASASLSIWRKWGQ